MTFPLFSKFPHFQVMLPSSLGITLALSRSGCPVGVSQPENELAPGRNSWEAWPWHSTFLGKKRNWTLRPPGAKGIQLGFHLEPIDNPRRIWEWAQPPFGTGSCSFCHGFFLLSCVSSVSFPAKPERRECLSSEVSGKLPPAGIRPAGGREGQESKDFIPLETSAPLRASLVPPHLSPAAPFGITMAGSRCLSAGLFPFPHWPSPDSIGSSGSSHR